MLRHFSESWDQLSKYEQGSPGRLKEGFYAQMYFDYWLASLFVLVEGYEKLGLNDVEVDALLELPTFNTLRTYRGGIYHFREKYWDDDVLALVRDKDAIQWCHKLHAALSKYMAGEMAKVMADDTVNIAEALIIK